MNSLRAVFVEDDPRLAAQLKPHYRDLFAGCGYSVEFFDASDESDAREAVEKKDPHLVICDLGFDKEFAGLHLIRTLRTAYPDLFFIGTSRGGYTNRDID